MKRAGRWVTVVALAVGLGLMAGGCGHTGPRTHTKTLNRAMSKAFKRASAAAYRMTTDHTWKGIVAYARVRCRRTGAAWHFACSVLWRRRFQTRKHFATYGISVDRLGCFQGSSGDFPPRLRERVLGRDASNPLVHIRSCP